jgi:DNA-binding MarR family transcriptional regulator
MNNNQSEVTSGYDTLFKPSERMRDLQFLEEIEQNPKVSQRELSNKFGIALGITNACIRRMSRRGLIKLKGIPPRRIAYYLTPKGFAEKANLTLRFFSYNIHHYLEIKKQISKKLLEMQTSGIKRIAFYGVSDEMEVAYITLQGLKIELVGILEDDSSPDKKRIFNRPIYPIKEVRNLRLDAILITAINEREKRTKKLAEMNGLGRLRIESL